MICYLMYTDLINYVMNEGEQGKSIKSVTEN